MGEVTSSRARCLLLPCLCGGVFHCDFLDSVSRFWRGMMIHSHRATLSDYARFDLGVPGATLPCGVVSFSSTSPIALFLTAADIIWMEERAVDFPRFFFSYVLSVFYPFIFESEVCLSFLFSLATIFFERTPVLVARIFLPCGFARLDPPLPLPPSVSLWFWLSCGIFSLAPVCAFVNCLRTVPVDHGSYILPGI